MKKIGIMICVLALLLLGALAVLRLPVFSERPARKSAEAFLSKLRTGALEATREGPTLADHYLWAGGIIDTPVISDARFLKTEYVETDTATVYSFRAVVEAEVLSQGGFKLTKHYLLISYKDLESQLWRIAAFFEQNEGRKVEELFPNQHAREAYLALTSGNPGVAQNIFNSMGEMDRIAYRSLGEMIQRILFVRTSGASVKKMDTAKADCPIKVDGVRPYSRKDSLYGERSFLSFSVKNVSDKPLTEAELYTARITTTGMPQFSGSVRLFTMSSKSLDKFGPGVHCEMNLQQWNPGGTNTCAVKWDGLASDIGIMWPVNAKFSDDSFWTGPVDLCFSSSQKQALLRLPELELRTWLAQPSE